LRSWQGKALALATRFLRAILRRGPHVSSRQAAYLFSECGAEAKRALELGWSPYAPLAEQIETDLPRCEDVCLK
jgi:hypothetical protein